MSSTGPGNQAATLLKVGRASMLTTLSLEPSHAVTVGILSASQSLVVSSWQTMTAAPLDQYESFTWALYLACTYLMFLLSGSLRRAGLLLDLLLAARSRLRLTTVRGPSRSLREPGLLCPLPGSATSVLLG